MVQVKKRGRRANRNTAYDFTGIVTNMLDFQPVGPRRCMNLEPRVSGKRIACVQGSRVSGGYIQSERKGVTMNERQWELYRLSVVETWSESPYKRAVSAAIQHKLMILGQHTAAGVNSTTTPAFR
jgi:hypothetical protein